MNTLTDAIQDQVNQVMDNYYAGNFLEQIYCDTDKKMRECVERCCEMVFDGTGGRMIHEELRIFVDVECFSHDGDEVSIQVSWGDLRKSNRKTNFVTFPSYFSRNYDSENVERLKTKIRDLEDTLSSYVEQMEKIKEVVNNL